MTARTTFKNQAHTAGQNERKTVAKLEAKARQDVTAKFRKRYGHDPVLLDAKLSSAEFAEEFAAETEKLAERRREFQSL